MDIDTIGSTVVGGGTSWGSYDTAPTVDVVGGPIEADTSSTAVGGSWSPEPAGNIAIFDGLRAANGGFVPQKYTGPIYPASANPQVTASAAAPKDDPKRPAAPAPAPARSVTVASGDSLTAIAAREGVDWKELYELNKSVIGANPNLIRPGQELKLP